MKVLTLSLSDGRAALVIEEAQTHTVVEYIPLTADTIERTEELLRIAKIYFSREAKDDPKWPQTL